MAYVHNIPSVQTFLITNGQAGMPCPTRKQKGRIRNRIRLLVGQTFLSVPFFPNQNCVQAEMPVLPFRNGCDIRPT
jgi:hypothetical protein